LGRGDTHDPQSEPALIALIDCDAFYCSCHAAFEPTLANSAISVASNNDGCLISLNRRAKALGLKMGDPLFKVQPLIKKHGVRVFSSSFYLYGDMSRRVMQILSAFSPEQEIYSIDESWLSLAGFSGDLTVYGIEIAKTIRQWTGIPVSIGIAPTKTLAKVTARLVKKRLAGTGAVCEWRKLDNPNQYLEAMPVTDLWGVSFRLGVRLNKLGIHTALQLKHADPATIRRHFGVVLERTVRELNGTACISLELSPPPKQQIMVSRSFGEKLTQFDDIRSAVSAFAARAGEKLRSRSLCAQALNVFIHTSPFDKTTNPYSNAVTIVLGKPCQDTRYFTQASIQGLRRIFKAGYKYQKAGVILLDLMPKQVEQLTLLNDLQAIPEYNDRLITVLDDINRAYGRDSIRLGGTMISNGWRMRQAMLSPAYTTRWEDIPLAKM
jgi:DNA polymerase V